jgi:OFA family oxalate/formate antiporter-like MFS transporter
MGRRIVSRRDFTGALTLAFAFGSLHAFSVLIEPLEAALGSNRAQVSLGYSIAIAALAAGVYALPMVRRHLSAAGIALLTGALGGGGIMLAASGTSVWAFLAGYGLLFGFANGMAYGLFLDRAAAAAPAARGFAIGVATAGYSAGAMVFSQLLQGVIATASVRSALVMLGSLVLVAGLSAAALFGAAGAAAAEDGRQDGGGGLPTGWILHVWAIYFLGAAAGLMGIAHTSTIVTGLGASSAFGAIAVLLVSGATLIGGALGGPWAEDRRVMSALGAPLVLALVAMTALLATGDAIIATLALIGVGAGYGALIAVIPVVVIAAGGTDAFPRIFGRVFSSWGAAGLAGPLIAGAIFSAAGVYGPAFAVAALALLGSLALCATLPDRPAPPPAAR